jgi:hypothetical protein
MEVKVKGYIVWREMCECSRGYDRAAVVVQVLSPGRMIAASREPCNQDAARRISQMMMAANTLLLLSPVRS